MDYYAVVSKIYEGADFNPACFNFTEQEARAKKLWRDERAMPTQQELEAAQVLANKDVEISALYETMVSEIYAQMAVVFGTTNDVSAQATAATMEAMLSRPASFVGQLGLVDEAAVLAYANTQLAAMDGFALYRLNRIEQFRNDRDAIINS